MNDDDMKNHPLAAFTHRDYRPDHQPIEIPKGIQLGPFDPSKAARMIVKAARKHAPNTKVAHAGNVKGGVKK